MDVEGPALCQPIWPLFLAPSPVFFIEHLLCMAFVSKQPLYDFTCEVKQYF